MLCKICAEGASQSATALQNAATQSFRQALKTELGLLGLSEELSHIPERQWKKE